MVVEAAADLLPGKCPSNLISMPLNAYHQSREEVICILEFDQPESEIDPSGLRCLECGEPMFIRAPGVRVTHFCHYPEAANECEGGESVRHATGKIHVARLLSETHALAQIEYEKQVGERRADILLTHSGGLQCAHEVQLSPLDHGELRQRSLDYHRQGTPVHWWFGPKINDDLVEWATLNLGGCSELEFGSGVTNEDQLSDED
jgi:competence CoiA-like predicted nuclease